MRMRRAQQLRVRHAREKNVIRETCLAGDFGPRVDPAARNTDYAQFIVVRARLRNQWLRRIFQIGHRRSRRSVGTLTAPLICAGKSLFSAILSMAASTASKIWR